MIHFVDVAKKFLRNKTAQLAARNFSMLNQLSASASVTQECALCLIALFSILVVSQL
jgi:hypothetical protein